MKSVIIRVQSIEDFNNGMPLFDLPKEASAVELSVKQFGILEGGTVGGDASIMMLLQGPGGALFVAQMTGNIFDACASAFKGARERFKENPSDGFEKWKLQNYWYPHTADDGGEVTEYRNNKTGEILSNTVLLQKFITGS